MISSYRRRRAGPADDYHCGFTTESLYYLGRTTAMDQQGASSAGTDEVKPRLRLAEERTANL